MDVFAVGCLWVSLILNILAKMSRISREIHPTHRVLVCPHIDKLPFVAEEFK
jgi:hypothetical protein